MEYLLALVLVLQVLILAGIWIGTNLQDRLWQVPVVGKWLDRRPGRVRG